MHTFWKTLTACTIAFGYGSASAGIITVGGVDAGVNGMETAETGVCTIDFNSGTSANACGATYTLAATNIVSGDLKDYFKSPSGDTTSYLIAGPSAGSPVTISLATPANYFGFYAGSLDSYNLVQFYKDHLLVDSFTGTAINAVAFPTTRADGSRSEYINYFASALFDEIVYSSSSNSFETDNHAIGRVAFVPEPASIALVGLGFVVIALRRRARN